MNFKVLGVTLMWLFLLSGISCKNSVQTFSVKKKIILLKSYKTPLVGGTGGKGMKISLVVQMEANVQLDSVVYNNRAGELNQVKKEGNAIWVESYFYDYKRNIQGGDMQEYKAEGNSCELFYSFNKVSESLKIPSLELKQDSALWR